MFPLTWTKIHIKYVKAKVTPCQAYAGTEGRQRYSSSPFATQPIEGLYTAYNIPAAILLRVLLDIIGLCEFHLKTPIANSVEVLLPVGQSVMASKTDHAGSNGERLIITSLPRTHL